MLQKVYVLGAGSMGCLLSHEISQAFPKQIQPVLLFRNQQRLNQFRNEGSKIKVVRRKDANVVGSEVQLESDRQPPSKDGKKLPIDNLILSTKTHNTIMALDPYVLHLNSNSNILILQNGMGMAQRLTEQFWPVLKDRPRIFQAVSTHGAYKSAPNVIQYAAPGKLSIAYIPSRDEPALTEKIELPEAFKFIVLTESLNAKYMDYEELLLIQMEKLVANACVNPMTAILDCFNGQLLHGTNVIPIFKRIIKEAIDVFETEYPELKRIPLASTVLNRDRLLDSVLAILKSTAQNSSSMREDVRHLAPTEIDWINGYIVYLGKTHRIPTPTNTMMLDLVKSKSSIDIAVEKSAAESVTFT